MTFLLPLIYQSNRWYQNYRLIVSIALINLQQAIQRGDCLTRSCGHGKQTFLLIVFPIFKSLLLVFSWT